MAKKLIRPAKKSRRTMVRQRALDDPPLTDCRIVDTVRLLHFAGAKTPDRKALVKEIRTKTERPESDGTNAGNIMSAMQKIAPWIPIKTRSWDLDKLMRALQRGRLTASIGTDYHLLPARQRRWSPSFTGGHQIGLAKAKKDQQGRWRVLWTDPLGTGGYKGEWVLWDDVRGAVHGTGGRVDATTLEKEAAVRLTLRQLESFEEAGKIRVEAKTQIYSMDKKSMALEPDRKINRARSIAVDGVWRIDQRPDWLPSGRFYRLAKGGKVKEYIRFSKAELEEAEPETIEEPEDFEDGTDDADLSREDGEVKEVVDADPGEDPGESVDVE